MRCASFWLSVFVWFATVASADERVDYQTQIKHLLSEQCFSCHGALRQKGGLRLDATVFLRKGGDSGPLYSDRNPTESLLIERVTTGDVDDRMPREGKPLTAEQIALLRRWIKQGAVAPDNEPIPPDPRKHWAFQPLRRPAAPATKAPWIRNELDRFIASKHEQQGLVAVGEPSRSILLRRVYFDLAGLPPTRDELQAFLADTSAGAYGRAVDRLLDSPRYGERWARHWMDIWRYSDPSGYKKEIRDSRKHIWRWRDWIIDSLNADKGYDRMLVEMLAADEAAPADVAALRATGFLARNWYKFSRNVWLDNIVEHSSKAFLGLTMNCARCHSHKYDPISQKDYYQMRAIFETHSVRDDPLNRADSSSIMVRAFDSEVDTPTYLFIQGDENQPDKDVPIKPAVPRVLGRKLKIEPVDLPPSAYYPALRPASQETALAAAGKEIEKARSALQQAQGKLEKAKLSLSKFTPAPTAKQVAGSNSKAPPAKPEKAPAQNTPAAPTLADDFTRLDPASWAIEAGDWKADGGHLVQSRGDSKLYRLLSKKDHPQDLHARLSLKITGGDVYRSVGIGFDGHGKAMHAVYLSVQGAKVQVTLQSSDGSFSYPKTGLKSLPLELNREYSLEVAVRDRLLNVSLDGNLAVAFNLPADRQAGKLAIWTFSATASFNEIEAGTLAPGIQLISPADHSRSKDKPLTKADLEAALALAEKKLTAARLHLATVEAQRESLAARYTAERAKYGLDPGDAKKLSLAASRSERLVAVRKLEEQLTRDRMQIFEAKQKQSSGDAKAGQAVAAAEKNLTNHKKQLMEAQAGLEGDSAKYKSLGSTHPKTSTGRRLALARWIASSQNPLAARVAVNHIWLRHFNEPLVERMFDFGLRSPKPVHSDLLDWLAVQFIEDGWSMKKLHRLIVTSGAYRRASSAGQASNPTSKLDPDNHFLWRMNTRRAEAEAVRDSILHLGGSLDLSTGGPPIDNKQGQSALRRSIFFRHDKERQMTFLSLFDGAKVNECYRRRPTVAPQQALAMYNSPIAAAQSQKIAKAFSQHAGRGFIEALFEHVLCRSPKPAELKECETFLADIPDRNRARQQLTLVLLNHNDFVTIR